MKTLSLNKSRHILQLTYRWYRKKSDTLPPEQLKSLEQKLLALEGALDSGDRAAATPLALDLESFYKQHQKKSIVSQAFELLIAIFIALLLALLVRQIWFELYEIPTGSMRPTYREQDRVAVSKTAFAINVPMSPSHFLFDPSNLRRGEVITFTTEGISNLDETTTFLGVIPYKKRLVKRLVGKPGDSLYFYGGKIYGVDSNDQFIDELVDAPWSEKLEYIPFIDFAGRVTHSGKRELLFQQFNHDIGKLSLLAGNRLRGEISVGNTWIDDDPRAQSTPHSSLKSYSDFFGIRNYAMARLLTRSELVQLGDPSFNALPDAPLYLELRHHPSLSFPQPIVLRESPFVALLNPLRSIIPLQQGYLDKIMDEIYTARLVFRNGRAARYNVEGTQFTTDSPHFANVPDGTYEFYYGQLQNVGWGAVTSNLPATHPLASRAAANVQKLFNLGIEVNNNYSPRSALQLYHPSRYAYFRDGDLYLLGKAILKKDDPLLIEFNERELLRQKNSSREKPYTAFKDEGAPFANGKVDVDFIRHFGIEVPKEQYLLLGDNHAMSGDSRVFGFIPEGNLQGSPSLLFWPIGERWGFTAAPHSPLFSLSRLIVWSILAVIAAIWYICRRRYLHRPIELKK